jgi:hypothetical protein
MKRSVALPDGDEEAKSELYDEINSLYDMENPRGEENQETRSQLSQ